MTQILTNDRVSLLIDLQEFELHTGRVGIVRHSWHYPSVAYEVEFANDGHPIRLLLLDQQVRLETSADQTQLADGETCRFRAVPHVGGWHRRHA